MTKTAPRHLHTTRSGASARPRIAIVTDAIGPYHRGGKEQRYLELAPRLSRYADVHVYTMKWWANGHSKKRAGVTYHAICPFIPLYRNDRRSIVQAIVFAVACLKLLFARFDAVEADHMPYLQLFSLKLVAVLRRKRFVVTWHEVWDRARWTRYLGMAGVAAWSLEQWAMRLPDCIMADSPHTEERLRRCVRGKVPIVTTPVGIDLGVIARTPAAGDPVDVVTVGRLLSHKRFDLLLESIALLANDDKPRTCRIIGDGPERRRLVSQARRLGIGHLVEFRHDVDSREELLSLVKASRLFVFPSEREGFGLAALEAIGCGVPVITTTAPDNLARHLVERSGCGVICEPTAEALAAAVASAHQDGRNPAGEGRDGHHVQDHGWLAEYDWTAIAARVAHTLIPERIDTTPSSARDAANADTLVRAHHRAVSTPPLALSGSGDALPSLPPIAGGAEPTIRQRGRTSTPRVNGSASSDRDGSSAPPVTDATEDDATEDDSTAGVEPAPEAPARPKPRTRQWDWARTTDTVLSVAAVAAMAGLAHVRGVWVLQAAELLLLLTVPGILFLRAARAAPRAVSSFPIYIVGASLTVLMCSGLAIDLLGPRFGVSRPLATAPLVDSLAVVCLLLVAAASVGTAPRLVGYVRGGLRLKHGWPLALPVLAWIGAMRLNNGHGATVAIVAASLTGVVMLIGVWRSPRWSVTQSAILVYGAALALMWSFSLRGHFVYGYDIASEYQTFIHVLHVGRWYPAHHNDPYGAMLSLTILPSTFVALTGASALLVLKAIYPLLFALFPVGVFLLARRFLSARFAYLAVLFILVQSYLFQQLPAIARQEIALILFAALAFAMLDRRLRQGSRVAILALLAVGLVMSHYSTAYLAAGLLVGALILELVRRRIMDRTGRVALVPLAVAACLVSVTATLWNAPITHSAQNVSGVVSDVTDHGLSILPNAGGTGIVQSYVGGNVVSQVSATRYTSLAQKDYGKRSYIHPLPQAYDPAFAIHNATIPGQAVVSHPLAKALDVGQVVVSQLAILLAVAGAFILWLRRDTGDGARLLAAVGIASVFILAALRFSGSLSSHYNQARAFLQAMLALSICLAWFLQHLSARWPRGRTIIPVLFALGLGLLFATNSGLKGVAIGGGAPTNLASKGEDFERYYFTQPELAAARWLNAAAPPGEIISTDRYGALRIVGATGRITAVFPDVVPQSLDRHAWIYADSAMLLGRRDRGQEGSKSALYAWPAFVDEQWNLVYTSGSAGVYARTH